MPCKCYGMICLRGTVQSQQTSSFIVIYSQRLSSLLIFTNFRLGASQFSLIKGRSSSDRLWKKEFFFISRNWVGNPIDVNNVPFPPFTSAPGHLRPEGMSFFLSLCLFYLILSSSNPLLYWCSYYSSIVGQVSFGAY